MVSQECFHCVNLKLELHTEGAGVKIALIESTIRELFKRHVIATFTNKDEHILAV